METYHKLKQMIAEIEPDMAKADGGNKAAGVRIRKAMQDLKALAQQIREEVLVKSKAAEGEKA
ncbi:MAG: histone H1 [Phycisphaerae bacterium]|nr:histone H1 [Phycisphaerae bacterium]